MKFHPLEAKNDDCMQCPADPHTIHCRAIVSVHGGRIWVENRKDGGASFHLTLPIEESVGRT